LPKSRVAIGDGKMSTDATRPSFLATSYACLRGCCACRRAQPATDPKTEPVQVDATVSPAAAARIFATRQWLDTHSVQDSRGVHGMALVYDETMQLHSGPPGHPEAPRRTQEILAQLKAAGLLQACAHVPPRVASEDELLLVHDARHVERVCTFQAKRAVASDADEKATEARNKKAKPYSFPFGPDTYVNEHTPHCARLSAGGLLALVDAALDADSHVRAGMAVVRPPGHHATADRTSGFCVFNNVAVAARYLQKRHGLERIAIVDWDVHHGNGTNDIFAEDPSVLFVSTHRYGEGFFPGYGFLEDAGKAQARGYNVNIPLEKGFSDRDIAHVMQHVICPLLERFRPDAILVSAGFDAAKGDPLGECRVSPEAFGWMTRCLFRLARVFCEDRIFLVLEGGYNPDVIAQCTVACVHSLLAEVASLPNPFEVLPALVPRSPTGSCTASEAASTVTSAAGTPLLRSRDPSPPTPSRTPTASPSFKPRLPPASPMQQYAANTSCSAAAGSGSGGRQNRRPRGIPSTKTMKVVRQLSEIHTLLPLQLPLAPKPNEAPGAAERRAKKSENRRNARGQQRRAGQEDDDRSDCSTLSGWAIACGSGPSDAEPSSPWHSRASPPGSPSFADVGGMFPSLELPPPLEPVSGEASTAIPESGASGRGPRRRGKRK